MTKFCFTLTFPQFFWLTSKQRSSHGTQHAFVFYAYIPNYDIYNVHGMSTDDSIMGRASCKYANIAEPSPKLAVSIPNAPCAFCPLTKASESSLLAQTTTQSSRSRSSGVSCHRVQPHQSHSQQNMIKHDKTIVGHQQASRALESRPTVPANEHCGILWI